MTVERYQKMIEMALSHSSTYGIDPTVLLIDIEAALIRREQAKLSAAVENVIKKHELKNGSSITSRLDALTQQIIKRECRRDLI